MQTPRTRTGSLVTPQRISPRSSEVSQKNANTSSEAPSSEAPQKVSPRVVRQLKTGPRYSEHTASSANLLAKAPKERSPSVADHWSPKTTSSEKKRPGRVSELENQISQLEKDLKIVKDQLCSTEEQKKLALRDADEYNQQLLAVSLKLEESQKQFSEQNTALASALDEVEQHKYQLEIVTALSKNSESELCKLKEDMSETLLLVEDMKMQLSDSKESEVRAHTLVGKTLAELETVKNTLETLKLDGSKAMEAVASELDRERARADSSEELVSKLKSDISGKYTQKLEVDQMRSALEAAELRYNDERARSEEEMRNTLEMVERMQSEFSQREADLVAKVRILKNEVEESEANLMDKETELQGLYEENEALSLSLETTFSSQKDTELETMLHKAKMEIENLKAGLMEKEMEWQTLSDENENLKSEIKEMSKDFEARDEIESARYAEREALMKLSYLTEEFEKGNRKAARVSEQLEATQAAKAEMEAEMRRMKVQSEQWRKAAEAAAAMISAGNNNGQQVMERTGSMDSHYNGSRMGKVRSPYGEDILDDDLTKKKNANMLRKFGVLWKKQQK